jgi:hypothetical protein
LPYSARLAGKSCLISISEALYKIENNARDSNGDRMTPQKIGAKSTVPQRQSRTRNTAKPTGI